MGLRGTWEARQVLSKWRVDLRKRLQWGPRNRSLKKYNLTFFQISDSIPLVGELEPVNTLQKEYLLDEVYQRKVADLEKTYKSIRRTRPDGNCFFRAFAYAYLEKLRSCPAEFKRFHTTAASTKDVLLDLGFPKFTVEDFYDTVST